jgi:hypothetical protein
MNLVTVTYLDGEQKTYVNAFVMSVLPHRISVVRY